ncbi:FAD-dependent oxidoreductase [Mesorhizobium sp. WSM4310]|nr:FAD-dependent oxidoreductase [Mesorhizobium sp. WSM4310]
MSGPSVNCAANIVVVGAGPAGLAAAIHARQLGLTVTLLERQRFPRHKPGETLHPGAESVLTRLGVSAPIVRASTARHEGISVAWGDRSQSSFHGAEAGVLWRGFQIRRKHFDLILLNHAVALGVDVYQPCRAERLLLEGEQVVGVETDFGSIRSPYVIDATGGQSPLFRRLGLGICAKSPTLIASYGYCAGALPGLLQAPRMLGGALGWSWIAQVSPKLVGWVRLSFDGAFQRRKPAELDPLEDIGTARGADVTWRRASQLAFPGYYVVGDAAAQLDPASSHGVLRALMTGMMASYQIHQVAAGTTSPTTAAKRYGCWVVEWWERDAAALASLYRQIVPDWPSMLLKQDRISHG